MKIYAFQLGRKRNLSVAELTAVLDGKTLIEEDKEAALFNLNEIDPISLQNRLGGTIKIMEITDRLPLPYNEAELKASLENLLRNNFKGHKGKVQFALSFLNFKSARNINIKQLLNFSKIFLKSLNLNARFVNKGRENPKPSTIYKAKVLQKGIDINVIKGKNNIYIGKTVAIQNIDDYSKRDYEKPKRDARIGMTPPKLAQIMINLAGPDTKTIYDPFCGTGTFLMEGMLMGKSVVGSDISPRLLEYAKINCEWLAKKFNTNASFRVFERDARFLTKELLPEKVDAIVTESYLGKPLSAPPSTEDAMIIFRDLENLYLNWLRSIHPLISNKTKVITCMAAIQTKSGLLHLPEFEKLISTAGFKIEKTFTYDRPDQIVIRDIAVLTKNNLGPAQDSSTYRLPQAK